MKISDKDIHKISSIIDNMEMHQLEDIAVFQEDDGSYNMFGKYEIKKVKDSYNVSAVGGNFIHSFYKLRYAVCWCIFDRRNKFYDSRKIIELDRQLSSIDIDIQIHQRLLKKSKVSDERIIFACKLNEDKDRRARVLRELMAYVIVSNQWQINRFRTKPEYY
jgi:hypothetical protein